MLPGPDNICDALAKLSSRYNLTSTPRQGMFSNAWNCEFKSPRAGLNLSYQRSTNKLEVTRFPGDDTALRSGLQKGYTKSTQYAREQKRLSKNVIFTWNDTEKKWSYGGRFLTNHSLAQALCEWLIKENIDFRNYAVSASLEGSPLEADCMNMTLELIANCKSESGKISPYVAALVVQNGEIIGSAYRGQSKPGDHAEYILLEQLLTGVDLNGATLYTTLEPCTTGRTPPKKPCVEHVIKRGISEVVIGMLDPDPRIYNNSRDRLRSHGISIRYYSEAFRNKLEQANREFVDQFHANPALSGKARFNYANNNGQFTIGHGLSLFETKWSKASNTAIHVYAPPGAQSIAIADGAKEFSDVIDAGIYDKTSQMRTVHKGEIVVLRNPQGRFAAVKITQIMDRSRPPDDRDELQFEYVILSDGSADFSKSR